MSLARYAIRTASFAALYLVATLLGHLTEVGRTGVALFWPAAVVGAVWLLAQAPYRMLRFDVIALGTVAASVAVTSHGLLAALALAVPQVVPAVLVVFLAQRWVPRTGPAFARLAGVAATAAAAGAVLHGVIDLVGFSATEAGYLIVRDTASVLLAFLALRSLGRQPAAPAKGTGRGMGKGRGKGRGKGGGRNGNGDTGGSGRGHLTVVS